MRKKRKRTTNNSNPLGFGIWYLMLNIPLVCFVKSGVTGIGVGTSKRAKQVDRAAPGVPFPIFFVPTFWYKGFENWSHRRFAYLSAMYYEGDGHTEWFWLPVAVPVICVMSLIWYAYLVLFGWLISGSLVGGFSSANKILIWLFDIIYKFF